MTCFFRIFFLFALWFSGVPSAFGVGPHLLLVDDDTLLREVVGSQLKELGYEVVIACGEKEALGIFLWEPTRFAAIISDNWMEAEHSGLALAKTVRKVNASVPFYLHTGSNIPASLLADSGVTQVIRKGRLADELPALVPIVSLEDYPSTDRLTSLPQGETEAASEQPQRQKKDLKHYLRCALHFLLRR